MSSQAALALRLIDLRRRYGSVRALDGLSLSAHAGEIYGLLGRNGAGKTTTLRALMGIVRVDGGEIELLGERVARIGPAHKRHLGYVSQEQTFYPWMSAEQLGRFVGAFYPTWDAAEYRRLLQSLDVPPHQRSAQLSAGTRTKLGLALALAPRPPLLLLDEPTAGLDPVARLEFNELVASRVTEHGTSVFLSSHLVDEVEALARRVGIIQAGRTCAEGSVQELRERVRHVESPVPFDPPTGFTRVRRDVWQAEPETWRAAEWPEGIRVTELSLSEIFLAFARTDAPARPHP